jgi:hypothetical protein
MSQSKIVKSLCLAVFLIVAGSMSSFAAQSKGDSSLQFGGGFFHAQGADSGTLNLDVSYGYFLSENWEFGVMQSVGYVFVDEADDTWGASTIPFINYYFTGLSENDSFQPFVGAFLGASYNENDTTGTIGPQVGFKSYITDKTYVVVRYRYEWFFDELTVDDIENTTSDGNHAVTLGVGFVF